MELQLLKLNELLVGVVVYPDAAGRSSVLTAISFISWLNRMHCPVQWGLNLDQSLWALQINNINCKEIIAINNRFQLWGRLSFFILERISSTSFYNSIRILKNLATKYWCPKEKLNWQWIVYCSWWHQPTLWNSFCHCKQFLFRYFSSQIWNAVVYYFSHILIKI